MHFVPAARLARPAGWPRLVHIPVGPPRPSCRAHGHGPRGSPPLDPLSRPMTSGPLGRPSSEPAAGTRPPLAGPAAGSPPVPPKPPTRRNPKILSVPLQSPDTFPKYKAPSISSSTSAAPQPPPESDASPQMAPEAASPAAALAALLPADDAIPLPYSTFSPLTALTDIPETSPRTRLSIKALMTAGLHFGHAPVDFHPHMLPFVYGTRSGIHIINLEHTLSALRRAMEVCREVALRGGYILFAGTKPNIHKITVEAAHRAKGFWVIDWKSGIITNRLSVLKRSTGFDPDKVNVNVPKGPSETGRQSRRASQAPEVPTPDLVIALDTPNLQGAINECNLTRIPVIALCDTNVNPAAVQYPIPGNDDSLTSVELVAGCLSLACREGHDERVRLIARHAEHINV